MDVPFAKTFKEYVAVMAANSPHALVMDSWRRLDLVLRDYDRALRQVVAPGIAAQSKKPYRGTRPLGSDLPSIRGLRRLRNQVAHEPIYNLSSEDAVAYARQAFSLIAALAKRVSHLEGAAWDLSHSMRLSKWAF
jgi:hypothetical protein